MAPQLIYLTSLKRLFMKPHSLIFTLLICLFFSPKAFAEIKGKIDLGPTLVSIDILESGVTKDTVNMIAIKGDSTVVFYKGLCLKPGFMVGGSRKGDVATFGIGLGHYTPIGKSWTLIPSAGVSFGYLRTHVSFEEFYMFDLKERFRSISPYLALEVCYNFAEKWYISAMYQYAWSRTHTKIRPIVSDTSHSNGPNYAVSLEYSLTQVCSITCGFGYNITLSKEKHGLRAKGVKLGLAYYF